MKRLLVGLIVLVMSVLWTPGVWALAPSSGTVTSHEDGVSLGVVKVFRVAYTTASSGGTFTCSTGMDITGWILLVETDPGVTTPTAAYDVTLVNDNGRDIMGGALTDRSDTATEAVMPLQNGNYTSVFNRGLLVITVTAAGNSKTSEIAIYYLPSE